MTKRELYNAVITNDITDEVIEGFKALVEGLDHTNELRKVSAARLKLEGQTATTLIAEAGVELKPQAIPSLLKALVAEGTIAKTEIKVTGKGKQVGYVRG